MSDSASLDAQVLMAHILGRTRAWVLAQPETSLTAEQGETLTEAISRLEGGVPLPYLLGQWEFFGLKFSVTPDVLIPRPETELMVEHALRWLEAHPDCRRIADIGTGSGCIAISLAVHVPDLQVWACDISPAALQVARTNAYHHGVAAKIIFTKSDLLAETNGPFDLICANLPYIPTETLHDLAVYGREPTIALNGGSNGFDLVQRLLREVAGDEATDKLAPDGVLLVEIEASQGELATSLARAAFPVDIIQLLPDLAGRDRLLVIQK